MNKKIIIGARGSKLSVSYAETVKKLFSSVSDQKMEIDIQTIKTSGDIFHDKKISDIGGKNIFCKEIERQLSEKMNDTNQEQPSDCLIQPPLLCPPLFPIGTFIY